MENEKILIKAKQLGINPKGMDQVDLIRTIQSAEGYESCYGHGLFVCNNLPCCWRESCLGICGSIQFEAIE